MVLTVDESNISKLLALLSQLQNINVWLLQAARAGLGYEPKSVPPVPLKQMLGPERLVSHHRINSIFLLPQSGSLMPVVLWPSKQIFVAGSFPLRWIERCEQSLIAFLELGLAKALMEREESTTSDNMQLKNIDREEMALILRPPCISSECVNETIRVKTILPNQKMLPLVRGEEVPSGPLSRWLKWNDWCSIT